MVVVLLPLQVEGWDGDGDGLALYDIHVFTAFTTVTPVMVEYPSEARSILLDRYPATQGTAFHSVTAFTAFSHPASRLSRRASSIEGSKTRSTSQNERMAASSCQKPTANPAR
jgi:hypothetical protein